MVYRWIHPPEEKAQEQRLCEELGVSPVLARMLINRGQRDPEKARQYLNPALKDLHHPFRMKDMGRAVQRILTALERGERILIHGDYDVDGLTATAVLSSFLQHAGIPVQTRIPDRMADGYGLKERHVQEAKGMGVSLLVTVDCGISDFVAVEEARRMGIDVVITDHHTVSGTVPKALAVVNPKQPDCPFPFKDLAGVGVAFHLVVALRMEMRSLGLWKEGREPNLKEYLDLVALGTIGDMAPLQDENRIFVQYGLKELRKTKRPGLRALMEVSGLGRGPLGLRAVSFALAPRINAAGRMGSARRALDLLLTDRDEEARFLAHELDEENRRRQQKEEAILSEAMDRLGQSHEKDGGAIVLGSEGWHPGVIGIVASKLVERFYRPTVLIAIQNGVGRGSCRSIDPFDLMEGLMVCGRFLSGYGGHRLAAGIEIPEDRIDSFRHRFNEVVRRNLAPEDFQPCIRLDSPLELSGVDKDLMEEMESLAPFGPSNPEPVFWADRVVIRENSPWGKNHIRFQIREETCTFRGIGFGMGHRFPVLPEGEVRVAYAPMMDEWQKAKRVRFKILDLKERG